MKEQKSTFMTKTAVVCVGAFICCLLWGSAFPCVKIGYRLFNISSELPGQQILFAGIRFTLAGLLALLFGSLTSKIILKPDKGSGFKILKLCMLQTVIQYIFFYLGLAHTTGVKASIIEAVNVFVAIFVAGYLFHQEKITVWKLVGCLIGFAGVVIVNLTGNGFDFGFTVKGEGMILFSTVAYAFSSVLMKVYSKDHNPVMLSAYQFMAGGMIMMVIGLLMGGRIDTVTVSGICMLVYLALISAVAYSLWGILLKYNPVSRVAIFGFFNPICGVILSAILLKEGSSLGGLCILALLLVCLGILIVNGNHKTVEQKK